jgi:hypothetical protein
MPKTREAKPAHRTKEPTHDLARRGKEKTRRQRAATVAMTEGEPERSLKDRRETGPTGPVPADDNEREAWRRMREQTPTDRRDLGPA